MKNQLKKKWVAPTLQDRGHTHQGLGGPISAATTQLRRQALQVLAQLTGGEGMPHPAALIVNDPLVELF